MKPHAHTLGPLPLAGRDHIQGSIDAPITIVEYGDFECPHCGHAYPILKAIQQRLGERLCFAFRNFPLANAHPHAKRAAEVAEAAGAHERFWEMHDLLFENQGALEDEDLVSYAQAIGLDAAQVMEEVDAGKFEARVIEDFRSGARIGVNGTPTLFLNGLRYDGPVSEAAILSAIADLG